MTSDVLRQLSLILAALIPLIFVFAALFVSRKSPFGAASRVTFVTVELAVLAVTLRALSFIVAMFTAKTTWRGHGLVQLDIASCAMLVLVCSLAVVVVRYSRTYLAGEAGLVRYSRSLLLTLAAVTILVISNHLVLLVAAWLGTGIGLHQLLTFFRTRRQAVIVAHKEFLLSRFADLCFFASLVIMDSELKSLRIDEVNAFAESEGAISPSLHLATVLLVAGVLLKSAQLPFHGWMQQVMEAPTPVSALLHAGIVNIGGFVMIRLAPLMARATIAQGVLLYVGLVTAIVGSLVMTTRVSVKMMLAWSTIAQMGFMLVQCALGVWHLALLHLLAHSLYKAHAFLSSGSVVETWLGATIVKSPRPTLRSMGIAAVVLAAFGIPLCIAFALSPLHASPGLGPLALALGLSFVPVIARALSGGRPVLKIVAWSALGATVLYFGGHAVFDVLAPQIDATHGEASSSFKWTIVVIGLVALFAAQTVAQTRPGGRLSRLLQPHLFSGLYIDEVFTRLTFRVWPPRLDRAGSAPRRSAVSITREAR